MGLPNLRPEPSLPAGRLRESHLLRLGLLTGGILALFLGLNWLLRGTSVTTEARLSLLLVLLLGSLIPRSLPRTLSSDGDQVRWKRTFQPPQTIARSEVSRIVYVPTAPSGGPRFYFIGRDGNALLWIDRFTPEQMSSFAAYLGMTLQTQAVAPTKSAAAEQAATANAVAGSRRSMAAVMLACMVAGAALTAFMSSFALNYRSVMAAYDRAPLCAQPASDPRSCRFDTPAQVTGFTAKGSAELRFPVPVPTLNRQTTWEGLLTPPDPSFSAGDTVQVEVFDGYVMAINGGRTTTYGTLTSNSSPWVIVAAAGLFVILPGIGLVIALTAPASWMRRRSASASS